MSLQPTVRRTWARVGCTPVIRHWHRGEKLSMLSVLAVSPQRRRLQLHWDIQADAYKTWDFVWLIRQVQRQLGRQVLLIWDRLPGHRAAARHLQCAKIQVEYLPAYAPELNPVEWAWAQTKYAELANWVPEDTEELEDELHNTLAGINQEQKLLRSFFDGAKLSLE